MSTFPLRHASLLAGFAIAGFTLSCTAGTAAKEGDDDTSVQAVADGQPGSHVGVHGMTLFGGAGKLYLSHIPLYSAPHNKQVLVEVEITAGVPAGALATFGTSNFTVRPSSLSLFDLAAGTLQSLRGTIYSGNFESGGRPLYSNVTFSVKRSLVNRAIGPTTPRSATLDYVAVGTPSNAYLVHLIDKAPSFDQVLSVKLPPGSFLDANALEVGTLIKAKGGVNGIRTRLAAGVTVEAEPVLPPSAPSDSGSSTIPDGDPTVAPVAPSRTLTVISELGCLPGPDFYGACPAAATTTR